MFGKGKKGNVNKSITLSPKPSDSTRGIIEIPENNQMRQPEVIKEPQVETIEPTQIQESEGLTEEQVYNSFEEIYTILTSQEKRIKELEAALFRIRGSI